MKLLFLWFILLISSYNSLNLKEQDDHLVLKLTEKYYKKIGKARIDEFRNMIFKELDHKEKLIDRHLFDGDNAILSRRVNLIKNEDVNFNATKNVTSNLTLNPNTTLATIKRMQEKLSASDYSATERILKFYISHTQECSVFINDTVKYHNINNINFVEHMILHNNAENIDPKGVYSDDVSVNFFAFNRKINVFSVYFNNDKPETKGKDSFLIEYDYDAINLIKSNIYSKEDSTFPNKKPTHNSNSTPTITEKSSEKLQNTNSFIWKILNQNFLKSKELLTIEVYFDLGKDFEHEDVEFSLNFQKSIIDSERKTIVKYEWKGALDPQEVLVMQVKFPLYFENCGNLSINLVIIFVGAVFIIFLIGMLYIILSTVFLDDL
jgi:hypothetical protein